MKYIAMIQARCGSSRLPNKVLKEISGKPDLQWVIERVRRSLLMDTFISSTFWTERIAFAATVASIDCYQKYQVEEHQKRIGKKVQEGWKAIAEKTGVRIHISGILPLSHFEFEYDNPLVYKTYFTQEMLAEGFLAGTGLYVSLAHTDEIVEKYLQAVERVFGKIEEIRKKGGDIADDLKGPVCHAGFERLN